MKKIITFIFLLFSFASFAQTLTVIVTKEGIAPVPAFAAGQPAALFFLNTNITKKLEYAPDFTYGLRGGKNWFMDNRIRFNQPLDSAKRWIATIGANWSSVFRTYKNGDDEVTQSVRYPTFEGKIKFEIDSNNIIFLEDWYMFPIETKFGSKGNYLSLVYTHIIPLEKFTVIGSLNAFLLGFSDGTKGTATSFVTNCFHNKSGLFAGFQIIEPFTSRQVKFTWTASIGMKKKLF